MFSVLGQVVHSIAGDDSSYILELLFLSTFELKLLISLFSYAIFSLLNQDLTICGVGNTRS